ncbi:MAG: hypothetical protein ACOX69_07520 [Coriobacteriales bacterium]
MTGSATLLSDVYLDAANGNDASSGATEQDAVKTIGQALELVSEGGTVHTVGTCTLSDSLTISKDVSFVGVSSNSNFLTVSSGATLSAPGKSITWTGYDTALTIEAGATLGDGTYTLDDVGTGLKLSGTLQGTSRSALKLTVNAKSDSVGLATSASTRFANATVVWNGGGKVQWTYRNLTVDNCDFSVSDVWLYPYPLDVTDSDMKVSGRFNSSSWNGGHVLSIYEKPGTLTNSTLVVDGSRINVINSEGLTLNNSTIEVKNSPDGGFNVNYGSKLVLHSSTIKSDGTVDGALVVAGYSNASNLYIDGSSVVETPGTRSADSVGVNGNYVVTGGTFKLNESLLDSNASLVPTNGTENGNEKLSLLTLADSSIDELHPVNANGNTYTYSVAKANSDGEKRVWVPAAKVTYKLNNANATFPDGTAKDKTFKTVSGYTLDTVKGFSAPESPTDSTGVSFLGWYYRDSSGTEHAFDAATVKVTDDLEVYAKWDSKSVVYHSSNGTTYVQQLSADATQAQVLGFDAIVAENSEFFVDGKTFSHWSTSADGTGESHAPGDTLALSDSEKQIDLYAQMTDNSYHVAFSANGGSFGADSIFRDERYFTIEKDSEGGDVAVLKASAAYGQALHDITDALGLDYNQLKPDATATLLGYSPDTTYWSTEADGGRSIRFDDYTFWGITIHGTNPTITSDVTYYMKWNGDVQSASSDLYADMWGTSQAASSNIETVKSNATFSVSGAIDTDKIKNQMTAIEQQFDEGTSTSAKAKSASARSSLSDIKLSRVRSTFIAKLTVPDGVVVPSDPEVTVTGLGDLFDVESTSIEGNTVTITMKIKSGIDDYQQLKDAVESTGTDENPSQIVATVKGLSLDANTVTDGQRLTLTGSVDGTFSATAAKGDIVHNFGFTWTGAQSDTGRDEAATDDTTIQYTIEAAVPLVSTLPGDILVGTDTEHTQTYKVLPGSTVDFTGALNVRSILDQMAVIEDRFGETSSDYEKIGIDVDDCTFTATFTIPESMSLPDNVEAQATDFGDSFSITGTSVSGNTVTVTMKLRDGISNYRQLKDAVEAAGDEDGWMHVTIPGVAISDSVTAGQQLTVHGSVSGTMDAMATKNSESHEFMFQWNSSQWPDGSDAIAASDSTEIQFTCEVASTIANDLPGDILVKTSGSTEAATTEHDAVYQTERGASLDYTGALDVTKIKEQMQGIEDQFGNPDSDSIAIDVNDFGFTAKIVFPEGLTPPSSLSASDISTENFGSGFEVTDVTVEGQTVTVEFGLADVDAIQTYTDLETVVDAAGGDDGWMRIVIPGVKVDSSVAADAQLTAVGALDGKFSAAATSAAGTRRVFSFTWTAQQWADGADAIQPEDSTQIQLTVQVKVESAPSENPETSVTPANPRQSEVASSLKTTDSDESANETSNATGTSDSGSSSTDNAVDTGDDASTLGIALVMSITAVAIVVVARRKRKAA